MPMNPDVMANSGGRYGLVTFYSPSDVLTKMVLPDTAGSCACHLASVFPQPGKRSKEDAFLFQCLSCALPCKQVLPPIRG